MAVAVGIRVVGGGGPATPLQSIAEQAHVDTSTLWYEQINGTSGFSLNSDDFGAFLPVDHHELVAGCMARQTPR